MYKKLISLVLVFALVPLVLLLTGCSFPWEEAAKAAEAPVRTTAPTASAAAAAETSDEAPAVEAQTAGAAEQETAAAESAAEADSAEEAAESENNAKFRDTDFTVTGEYLYEGYGNSLYFVTVCNHSDVTVTVSGTGTAIDEDGDALAEASMTIQVLGPGEESIGYFGFADTEDVASVDYSLTYREETKLQPVLGDLKVEQSLNDANVTLAVTNDGEENARLVDAYALFLTEDNRVTDYVETYITDGDYVMKPGETLYGELCSYEEEPYDHVVVALTGYADPAAEKADAPDVSDSDFHRSEYLYVDGFGTAYYFVVVKNNSDETVEISGNAAARDAAGNTIGAASMTVDVLGPGEESIGYFSFDDGDQIDDVDCRLSYSKPEYMQSALGSLTFDTEEKKGKVKVTVTNNGDTTAEYVQAYVLFFNAEGDVVDYGHQYITDDSMEIAPGDSYSGYVRTYGDYDHIGVYLAGIAAED